MLCLLKKQNCIFKPPLENTCLPTFVPPPSALLLQPGCVPSSESCLTYCLVFTSEQLAQGSQVLSLSCQLREGEAPVAELVTKTAFVPPPVFSMSTAVTGSKGDHAQSLPTWGELHKPRDVHTSSFHVCFESPHHAVWGLETSNRIPSLQWRKADDRTLGDCPGK